MGFDKETLAANLRMHRARLDISQGELADRAGLNVVTVCKYEDGTMTPGADKLAALCGALHCTPNDLLGWK